MTPSATAAAPIATAPEEKHPKGLYVLFATEMWERFSYYSMLAMFTLYLLDDKGQGFAWSSDDATKLYANYLMFVYASPLIGGWLADRKLGYRRAVMIGGFFFMAGHLLLSFRSMTAVYAALTCLVIGNGLFKPNVSAMVGNLYPEGSHLKDRAYNIFYMGINVGATLAPIVAEFVKGKWGFHVAFAVAAAGMALSVATLWKFKRHIQAADSARITRLTAAHGAAVAVDAPPASVSHQDEGNAGRQKTLEEVPEWKRIGALIVIFIIVIIFWMVFHQNGSTMTYWANDNTDWSAVETEDMKMTGIISNAINPGWVILLTFPMVAMWRWLDKRGMEPSTPVKMAIGMFLTGAAFFVLYLGAKVGEARVTDGNMYNFRVSPLWLLGAYGVLSAGELMLSPMGLSLVSKVAPVRFRGVMMGGWFMATAIGNKLTQIGQLWDDWLHSSYWLLLSACAAFMALVLLVLLKPLKKAMPGV
ncbi:MAG TPA: peptide MFS transporter [Chthoniobacterales bacterium]|jgi:POT family proton-dependent oligopeptide transporter